MSELAEIMSSPHSGAIVYISPDSKSPSLWTHFLNLEHHKKKAHLKRLVLFRGDDQVPESEIERPRLSLRKLLLSLFLNKNKVNKDKKGDSGDDVYNLYDRNPDFKNNYGWSMAIDETQYKPLNHSGIGVYLVNLTAVLTSFTQMIVLCLHIMSQDIDCGLTKTKSSPLFCDFILNLILFSFF